MKKSILKKSSYITVVIALITLIISYFILNFYKENIKQEVYNEETITIQSLANAKLEEKFKVGISNAISIANDGKIKEALETNNRELAIEALANLSKNMKDSTPFDNIKVHVHTKDNHSFLRNWNTKKYGDDLSTFRKSVLKVNNTKKAITTFEVGKAGLSIRSVVPILKDDIHLGSLEFMQGVNSVAKDLNAIQDGFLLLMDNSLAIAPIDESKKLNNYTISQKFINENFFEDLKSIDLKELLHKKHIESNNYLYTYINIKDYEDNVVGIAVLARPLKIINLAVDKSTHLIYIALILLVVALLFNMLISIITMKQNIINPIKDLNNAINRVKNDPNSDKIPVREDNEIGEVVNSFNDYLNSIQEKIIQDKKVIDEARKVMGKVNVGLFNDRIDSIAASNEVNNLIESINEMIESTQRSVNEISKVLIALSNAEFDYKIPRLDGVTGLIASLLSGTRVTQSTISQIMALIDNATKKLTFAAEDLSKSSYSLSVSANQQAAALEETAAAIEEVSSTIQGTSEHAAKMAMYAENVTNSSKKGIELASKTSTSMDQLSSEVNTINEAITVIDQIAFQTNILSLNAAVEAATAGEAGKGFAVVAQEVRNLAARSAEAANEIKNLVQSATLKAKEGKEVSSEMIEGFNELNKNIATTINLIDEVANATKEQKEAMQQINDTVNSLDTETQQNAQQASNISNMASQSKDLALQLQEAVDRTKYSTEDKRRVCDTNMIFDLNHLKTDHINFKNVNFRNCKAGKRFKVKSHTECNLGKWILANENSDFAKNELWTELKQAHMLVHHMVQDVTDLYAEKYENGQIISVTENLELQINHVFEILDKLKEHNCDIKFQQRKGIQK